MKYLIRYKYPNDNKNLLVGFANSIEEFIALNNKRTYPYNYVIENLSKVELTTDIFSPARIEGESNFQDYFR